MGTHTTPTEDASGVDSSAAWWRLSVCVLLSAIGGVGMWSVVVALPAVEAEFGSSRAGTSLSYTLLMLCFGFGGVVMGRISDRFGIVAPALAGTLMLSAGYALAGASQSLLQFALAHGLLGLGASATFGPLIADISHWFVRRRGIAVAICASGNYLAGAVWPPVIQAIVEGAGWRSAHYTVAIVVLVAMIPLLLLLRRRPPVSTSAAIAAARPPGAEALGLSPRTLTILLMAAGVACCVAMAMPQVHIVAYCGELGYGAAAGAQMLSLMLGLGIVSRVASGFIADRIGGLATLLLGSTLQALALVLYLTFDGLASLYVISALFGLFQGGIVPSYAIVVREYFAPREAGERVGIVLMATIVGMALGGWLSGYIFDLTGSYAMAFLNGAAWNLLNIGIVAMLLVRRAGREKPAAA